MLGRVAEEYLTFIRHYGRFPFRVAFAGIVLFGPLALALEVTLLLRIGTRLDGPPPIPAVAVVTVAAAAFYAIEYALVRRLVERVENRA
ncbi:hypothetical protein HUG10_04920 [Halorarum halophilum]|uniref:Uncharacterized protein n=1 Tax=Halorarum halophilum TaxID=2743090 RepID=A0A7D5KLL4_9EURY|nr:hypothetical protein [Halobaculum halophilum]QLG26922.1 hypothetical protein HUG10_04920 [Halobaculum halophilum]